jgi:hypothetical protein
MLKKEKKKKTTWVWNKAIDFIMDPIISYTIALNTIRTIFLYDHKQHIRNKCNDIFLWGVIVW